MEVDIMLEDVKSPENDDDTRMTDDDALHDDDTSATSSKVRILLSSLGTGP